VIRENRTTKLSSEKASPQKMAARALGFVMARGSLRLGAVAPRRFMGAVSTGGVDMNLGRTPERTAELEKLAEEHNGFLFGELVRSLLSQAPGCPGADLHQTGAGIPLRTLPSALRAHCLTTRVWMHVLSAQPLKEGESRQWADWEYSYVPLMTSAFILYGLAYYYRCANATLSRPPHACAAVVVPIGHAD